MQDNSKVVVITGASSGIGAATARHLATAGMTVVLGARREDRLQALVAEIEGAGGKAAYRVTDVTRSDDMQALLALAKERFGQVDVMINNAGLMALGSIHKVLAEDWDRMVDINIKGVLHGIAAALPIFQQQEKGHFINVGSIAGHKVVPNGAVYSATKYAVRALSEGLRQEGGTIRTTLISPGAIDTELPMGSSDEKTVAAVKAGYADAIAPERVAESIAWAIAQPAEVDINELTIRPTVQAF
ncbi:SDR family oxidoreductase [Halopseudomonas salegens]|uniref:NADP-dependent 3-hydroxy acid dehydrogenase YdfG n=1 Tax=Halopseudomonas salegens TaxID=1434072 RepID=A0A1H2G4U5_9GAMM|nr:SDR family oxidoreductase [Halopseudomonas salegens]SDU14595.1 NADP-dependent 3-hydroxy acid dehydrogenase YdfG [Halopseudomonas salegens]